LTVAGEICEVGVDAVVVPVGAAGVLGTDVAGRRAW
jgi:hypothetical protein